MLCCLISRHVPYYCLQYVWIPVNFHRCVNNGRPRMVKVNPLVGCKVRAIFAFSSVSSVIIFDSASFSIQSLIV